jgi:hypothetical protein
VAANENQVLKRYILVHDSVLELGFEISDINDCIDGGVLAAEWSTFELLSIIILYLKRLISLREGLVVAN